MNRGCFYPELPGCLWKCRRIVTRLHCSSTMGIYILNCPFPTFLHPVFDSRCLLKSAPQIAQLAKEWARERARDGGRRRRRREKKEEWAEGKAGLEGAVVINLIRERKEEKKGQEHIWLLILIMGRSFSYPNSPAFTPFPLLCFSLCHCVSVVSCSKATSFLTFWYRPPPLHHTKEAFCDAIHWASLC